MSKQQQIDPSIFQYDQVYEQIKAPKKTKPIQKQQKPSKQGNQNQTSKYIGKMKNIVQRRDKDHKRAMEKKQQRQNAKLGIGEEQVFITESYLKKKQEEEQLRKQEKLADEQDKKHSVQDKNTARVKMNDFRKKLLDNDI